MEEERSRGSRLQSIVTEMSSSSSDGHHLLSTTDYNGVNRSPPTSRKYRRGCLITGGSVSALLVLAICLAVVVSPKFAKQPEALQVQAISSTAHFKAVADVCNTVQYPPECMASLQSAQAQQPNAFGDPTGFSNVVVNSALGGIGQFYSFASNLQGSTAGTGERYALSSCLETLQDSQGEMYDSLSQLVTINPLNFQSKMTDVLTWLSAALTYHTTCLDGWDDNPGTTRDAMYSQAGTSQILVANAVSLVSNLVGSFQSQEGTRNRRLLSAEDEDTVYEMDGEYPQWMRGGVRRLLQATTNLTIYDAVVSQDGTGQYTSIQDAVNNAPQNNAKTYVIKINQGTYAETVKIPKAATNIMFVGDGMFKTVVTGSQSVVGSNVTTFMTATIAIVGRGFVARDMSFRNTAGAANHQAVAARVDSDKSAFFRCSFEGYQDTLYAHTKRQFYKNCTIYGTVDFVFGNAAALFQTCTLLIRAPLPGQFNTVTAQGRTIPQQNTGFSFQQCFVDAAPDLRQALATQPIQSYLGRPWKLYSRTVFLESYMSDVINPAGWFPWNGTFALSTLFYGEYRNSGPGAAFNQRVSWSTQITDPGVASRYTVSFIEGAEWLPQTNIGYQGQL